MADARMMYLKRSVIKGVERIYYRRETFIRRLPGEYGSPEFMAAYDDAGEAFERTRTNTGGVFRSKKLADKGIGYLLRASKERAKMKSVPHTLSRADIDTLMDHQKGRCALTGMALVGVDFGTGQRQPFAPSLDRINPDLGYVMGNVRIVCQMANMARNVFSDEAFYKMCRAAAAFEKRDVEWKTFSAKSPAVVIHENAEPKSTACGHSGDPG
jgi:hypothetical protein